jgi:hypothetical protein
MPDERQRACARRVVPAHHLAVADASVDDAFEQGARLVEDVVVLRGEARVVDSADMRRLAESQHRADPIVGIDAAVNLAPLAEGLLGEQRLGAFQNIDCSHLLVLSPQFT